MSQTRVEGSQEEILGDAVHRVRHQPQRKAAKGRKQTCKEWGLPAQASQDNV